MIHSPSGVPVNQDTTNAAVLIEKDQTPFIIGIPGKRAIRIAWWLAILALIVGSLLPSDSVAIQTLDRLPLSDKMEHAGMYGWITFLPSLCERRSVVIVAALGAIALGVGLEIAQLLTGWRDFEVADMVADTVGVCIGLAVGLAVRAGVRSGRRSRRAVGNGAF